MKKRLFAGFLALCMMLSVMPATAYAEETAPEEVICTQTEDCEAETHDAECPKAEVEDEVENFTQLPAETSEIEDEAEEETKEEAEVEETEVEPVSQAEVTYVAEVNGTKYETHQEAVNAVKDGSEAVTIELLRDATLAETDINCALTLNGNGHTVTGTTEKMFRNFADATYNNVTIVNENGRCIETRSGSLTLTLNEVSLQAAASTTQAQALTIGGSGTGINVNITNSSIDGSNGGYGIITFNPVTMNITGSTTVGGFGALYFKAASNSEGSAGSVVTITDSTVGSKNVHTGESNNFGTIIFEDSNITVNTAGTSVIKAETDGLSQGAFLFNVEYVTGTLSNIKVNVTEGTTISTAEGQLVVNYNNDGNHTVILPESYASDVLASECGYKAASEGYIQITNQADAKVVALANGVGYTSLQAAVDAVKDGSEAVTIELLADATLAETDIKCALTLNGNGHTVTGTTEKMFRNFADATYNNVTIINENGRCIETRSGNLTLTLNEVSLQAASSTTQAQALTIGGSGENIKVNITNSSIDGSNGGYGIITFNPVEMKIEGSTTVGGFGALYFKSASSSKGSAGSEVTIKDSTVGSKNVHTGESNNFGTIIFEDSNITVNTEGNTTIKAETEGLSQAAFLYNTGYATVEGITVNVANGTTLIAPTGELLVNYSADGGHTFIVPAEYAGMVTAAGWTYNTIEDGRIQIGDIEVTVSAGATTGNVTVPESATDTEKAAANTAQSTTTADAKGLTKSVSTETEKITDDTNIPTKATEALVNAGISTDDVTITVVVEPYLNVNVTDIDEDAVEKADEAIITLDIKMLYNVKATTAESVAEMNERNTAIIPGMGGTVTNPQPVTISFQIPTGIITQDDLTGKVLYIEHEKNDGSLYYHKATIAFAEGTESYDTISFYNDRGYSEFRLMIGETLPENKPVQSGNGGGSSSSSSTTKKEETTSNAQLVETVLVSAPVATGDSANTFAYVVMIAVAGAAVALLTYRKRRA